MTEPAKHTPGPWNDLRVGMDSGTGRARSYEAQLCNASGVAVVIVQHDGSAEARANVELMRHAPELLADCDELRQQLCDVARDAMIVAHNVALASTDRSTRDALGALAARMAKAVDDARAVRKATT
jgi:hypothetical protein